MSLEKQIEDFKEWMFTKRDIYFITPKYKFWKTIALLKQEDVDRGFARLLKMIQTLGETKNE